MRTFAQKPKATQQTTSTTSPIPDRAQVGQSHAVNAIRHLQRTIGNQAVQLMLQTKAEELDGGLSAANSVSRGAIAPSLSAAPTGIQRRVEMRGVGRGEASGLPRLPELIERLNAISSALIFSVTDTVLSFVENPYGTQTEFDRQMIAFIGDARILPLRLTTREALQGDRVGGFDTPVDVDGYTSGYVDLDDLLASSDLGLQTSLVHLLRERQETGNYARRMGIVTGPAALLPNAEFDRSHARGIDSELALLRDFFGDPGIRIIDANTRHFRSTRGDGIHETQRHGRGRAESGIFAISWEVRLRDGRRMTPEEYRALLQRERAAAAPPLPVAPAPAPVP